MSDTAAAELERAERRLDLDWVRIGAFALLILYHVGMFYVPWDWHVKSPRLQGWLEPVMMTTHPWRLPLLFLVSGAATRFMADKMSAARLAGLRIWRLLPPLVFGIFVVVPPQSWLQVADAMHGPPMAYGAFWLKYATAQGHWCDANGCLITPTWNHLWFVAYLLAYTLLLCGALALAGRARLGRWQAGAERVFSGWGAVAWPAAVLIAVRVLLAPRFPETHMLVGDWALHGDSLAPFLFGFLFAKSDRVWGAFVKARWPLAAVAAAGYAVVMGAEIAWPGDAVPPAGAREALRAVYGLHQWTAIAAILGFARMHLATRDGPVRRYLTEAIFPFYIVHQTIIVVFAWWLSRQGLPLPAEGALVVAVTVAGCFATFEIARRVPVLRPLFGLRWKRAGAPASAHRVARPAGGVGLGAAGQHPVGG